MHRSRVISMVLLATYLACMTLVFSFILFEVLDVDGSDFPVGAPSAEATPVHPAEHDFKRTHLVIACQPVVDLPPPLDAAGIAVRVQRTTWLGLNVAGAPAGLVYRVVLARASLSDDSLPS